MDLLICAYPILILNIPVFDLNNHWYFYAVVLSFFSTIDPFFRIHFARHKITDSNYTMCVFRISMSVFVSACAILMPLLGSSPTESIEQANDIFFIVFSLLCFTKFLTLFTHVILKNRIVRKTMTLVRQTTPFILTVGILFGLILVLYSHFGRILFGGRIHNLIVQEYIMKTGFNLKQNYWYFHFNDIFSSFLTLLVLLIGHNWVFVTELLFYVNNSFWTVAFIVSYQLFTTFILTSLFYGVISRLIMISFENEFDHFDVKKSSLTHSIETATNSSMSAVSAVSGKS